MNKKGGVRQIVVDYDVGTLYEGKPLYRHKTHIARSCAYEVHAGARVLRCRIARTSTSNFLKDFFGALCAK